jgi:hypothetical protein
LCFVFTFVSQYRGAALRRAIKQTGMMRLCPDGLARLDGYGVPARFAQLLGEDYNLFLQRSVQSYVASVCAAVENMMPFDTLVDDVSRRGIGAVQDFPHFVVVPALAPLNAKMSGKRGDPNEAGWSSLVTDPLVVVCAPVGKGGPFSTATTTLLDDGQRLQQALRVAGKDQFVVAAVAAGLPFDEVQLWPAGATLAQHLLCATCRGKAPDGPAVPVPPEGSLHALGSPDCPECAARLERLHSFLDLGARLLLAAREHATRKMKSKTNALLTWCADEGKARAERLQRLRIAGLAMDSDGIMNPSALDLGVLSDNGIRTEIGHWSTWVGRVALSLHDAELNPEAIAYKVFLTFRLFGLAPTMDWKDGTGAKSTKSAAKDLMQLAVVNRMINIFERFNNDLLTFVKLQMSKTKKKEDGEGADGRSADEIEWKDITTKMVAMAYCARRGTEATVLLEQRDKEEREKELREKNELRQKQDGGGLPPKEKEEADDPTVAPAMTEKKGGNKGRGKKKKAPLHERAYGLVYNLLDYRTLAELWSSSFHGCRKELATAFCISLVKREMQEAGVNVARSKSALLKQFTDQRRGWKIVDIMTISELIAVQQSLR